MKTEKAKSIKRISLFVALAALICMSLAVSVFANTSAPTGIKGDTCYTVGDVNGDGAVTKADAVYLLYHSLFDDEYALKQDGNFTEGDAVITGKDALKVLAFANNADLVTEVHAYDEPIWTWVKTDNGMEVSAAYECACGDKVATVTVGNGVDVVSDTKAATCTTAGSITYTATATYDGVVYTATKTETIPATGHKMADVKACEDNACQNTGCTYVEKGAAHTVDLDNPTQKDVLVDGCTYMNQYACSECGTTVDGPTYTKHDFAGTIKTPATCSVEGVMLYTCKDCGATEEKAISKDASAHTWNEGETVDGNILYTCTGCGATKTTIKAEEGKAASATVEDLGKVDEVEVNGAAIQLDETVLGQLGGTVTIDAQQKTAAEAGVSDEIAEKIGDQKIYDFTLESTEGTTTDGNFGTGKVTVTIPYTLSEGEDPDCIEVWYIATDNTVTSIQGKYSDGNVTFETNHFSYYTVVRLTPAERCAKYGCNETEFKEDATCTTAGYVRTVCLRCGKSSQVDIAATGHAYGDPEEVNATCTENGYKKTVCSVCDDTKEEIYPATGHAYGDAVTVDATCSTKGYKKQVCTIDGCNHEEIEYDSTPIGHDYKDTWTWDEDTFTATVKLECQREGCDSVVEENAVVAIAKQIAASCSDQGETVYTAQIQIGNFTYDDVYTVVEEQLAHKLGNEVKYNTFYHYKECSACGSRVNEEEHELDEGEVTAKATCGAAGVMTYTCSCGYTEEAEIPALSHNIVNGKCTECGFVAINCDHEELTFESLELVEEDGYCGVWFGYSTCECGEVIYIDDLYTNCDAEYENTITKDANGYVRYETIMSCEKCGLHAKTERWFEAGEGCEVTCYASYEVYGKDNEVLVDVTGIYYEEQQHGTIVYVSQEDLSKYGICGGTATITKCVCGECDGISVYTDCTYEYDEELGNSVCTQCGLYTTWDGEQEPIGNCQYKSTYVLTLCVDEEELVSYTGASVYTYHENTEITYDLHGSSCSDGFTVVETCKDCGYVDTWEEEVEDGYHPTTHEEWDISEYELCSQTTYKYECPCGESVHTGIGDGHYWVWDEDDYDYIESEDGTSFTETGTAKCESCGLERNYTFTYQETDEPCGYVEEYTCVFSKDGKEIITEHNKNEDYNHNEVIIAKEFLGDTESCEDGVRITTECTECGYVDTYNDYWHREFVIADHDSTDYGMCDGRIWSTSCACGEVQDIYWDTECDWYYMGYDPATGAEVVECGECGIVRHQTYKDEALEGCTTKRTAQYDFIKGLDVVLSVKSIWYYENHDMEYNFVLDDPNGACYDGYTVTQTCKNCDYTYSQHRDGNPEGYHETHYQLGTYNMQDYGMCYGEVNRQICPCGNEYYYQYGGCEWMPMGYDEETDTEISKCNACGATRHYAYTFGAQVGCQRPIYRTYTYFDANGKQVLEYSYEDVSYNHDYIKSVSLLEGSTTCEDGVLVSGVCADCGDSYSHNTDWHERGTIQRVDLSEYGSVCGAYLVEEACACGENHYTTLTGECDFGWMNITPWLGENYGYQETTDGYQQAIPEAFDIKCALTDPECGASLRMCRYYVWDEENCSMQKIEVWQLGYDSSTGTCQKEIEIVVDTFAFHSYKQTYVEEGNVYTTTNTCEKCNSTSVRTETRDENGHILRYEHKWTNTLNNGEAVERVYADVYEYDATYDFSYNTMWYNSYTYADGRVEYSQSESTYDKENCTRTRTDTYSDGYTSTWTEEYHPVHGTYVQLVSPSCTQIERWGHEADCPVCEYYVLEGPYENEPYGHEYYQTEDGTYVCYRCELEGTGSLNGSIVLEDMSARYGNDTNYVIGYWNKGSIEFRYYVSIINSEGKEEILDVAIDALNYDEDGICALSINKAEVAAAAANAELEGDIRVTFVPIGDATLDYAITLTE